MKRDRTITPSLILLILSVGTILAVDANIIREQAVYSAVVMGFLAGIRLAVLGKHSAKCM